MAEETKEEFLLRAERELKPFMGIFFQTKRMELILTVIECAWTGGILNGLRRALELKEGGENKTN